MLEIVVTLLLAYGSGRIYAWFNGDKQIAKRHPYLKQMLHVMHHWQFIFASLAIAILFEMGYDFGLYNVWLSGVLWLGIWLFLEDFTFHMIHGGWWKDPEKKQSPSEA